MIYFLAVVAAGLGGLVMILTRQLAAVRRDAAEASAQSRYEEGYRKGSEDVRRSIRYEEEITECKRSRVLWKDVVLKVRQRVLLDNLRVAEWEREVEVSSEVNGENVWHLLEATGAIVNAPRAVGAVRLIGPAVANALSAARKGRAEGPEPNSQA